MPVRGPMTSMWRLLPVPLAVVVACVGSPGDPRLQGAAPTSPGHGASARLVRAVCALPTEQLQRIRRGYHPERSGEIQMVPEEPNFIGKWLSHSGPWEYVQRVPLFLYGPGHVPSRGRVARPATVADLAPTLAEHLRFDFPAPDGHPLREAAPVSPRPPRLILTLVWDSVGRNVLAEHPDAWPNLRGLIRDGVWFDHATVGSSPSVTPSVHATIGTGAFPRTHGLIDMVLRRDGEVAGALGEGPDDLLVPALADLYGAALENAPAIGVVAWRIWHLPLIGQGSRFQGREDPVALLRVDEEWGLTGPNESFYRTPAYPNDVEGWEKELRRLDLEDGEVDGEWMGESLYAGRGAVERTPAFTEYQTRVVEEVIRQEGFGADEIADLLFVNYNEPDKVGHRWSLNSPNMAAVLRSADRALGRLIAFLDREIGEEEWVVALTADHGSTPDPRATGATVIDNRRLAERITAEFGEGVLEQSRVTQLWIDREVLEANGFTLDDVATFVADYSTSQNVADPSLVPEEERDERLFAAAFPGTVLETLRCPPPTEP